LNAGSQLNASGGLEIPSDDYDFRGRSAEGVGEQYVETFAELKLEGLFEPRGNGLGQNFCGLLEPADGALGIDAHKLL
jgi:hypothetical protein